MSGWKTTATYIPISYQVIPLVQYRRDGFGNVTRWTASRTITEEEAPGIVQANADSIAAAAASPTVTAKSVRQNDAGAYKVVKTTDVTTNWVQDT